MQGDDIGLVQVDPLNDVLRTESVGELGPSASLPRNFDAGEYTHNLATIRPVWIAKAPPRRPSCAAPRHANNVRDDQGTEFCWLR